MPRCGTTFDENSVPPWTRGDFRGFWGPQLTTLCGLLIRNPPRRLAPPLQGGDFHRR